MSQVLRPVDFDAGSARAELGVRNLLSALSAEREISARAKLLAGASRLTLKTMLAWFHMEQLERQVSSIGVPAHGQ